MLNTTVVYMNDVPFVGEISDTILVCDGADTVNDIIKYTKGRYPVDIRIAIDTDYEIIDNKYRVKSNSFVIGACFYGFYSVSEIDVDYLTLDDGKYWIVIVNKWGAMNPIVVSDKQYVQNEYETPIMVLDVSHELVEFDELTVKDNGAIVNDIYMSMHGGDDAHKNAFDIVRSSVEESIVDAYSNMRTGIKIVPFNRTTFWDGNPGSLKQLWIDILRNGNVWNYSEFSEGMDYVIISMRLLYENAGMHQPGADGYYFRVPNNVSGLTYGSVPDSIVINLNDERVTEYNSSYCYRVQYAYGGVSPQNNASVGMAKICITHDPVNKTLYFFRSYIERNVDRTTGYSWSANGSASDKRDEFTTPSSSNLYFGYSLLTAWINRGYGDVTYPEIPVVDDATQGPCIYNTATFVGKDHSLVKIPFRG